MRCHKCKGSTEQDFISIIGRDFMLPAHWCPICRVGVRSNQVITLIHLIPGDLYYYKNKLTSGRLTLDELYHIVLEEGYKA